MLLVVRDRVAWEVCRVGRQRIGPPPETRDSPATRTDTQGNKLHTKTNFLSTDDGELFDDPAKAPILKFDRIEIDATGDVLTASADKVPFHAADSSRGVKA